VARTMVTSRESGDGVMVPPKGRGFLEDNSTAAVVTNGSNPRR